MSNQDPKLLVQFDKLLITSRSHYQWTADDESDALEARAALAELIEADREFNAAALVATCSLRADWDRYYVAKERRHAALARVVAGV